MTFLIVFILLSTNGCIGNDGSQEPQQNIAEETPESVSMEIDPSKSYTAVMTTDLGDISLKLFAQDAPKTVENFVNLAQNNFYDGVTFHRVIPGFMIQSGDPKSKDANCDDDGTGGPGYDFEDEINEHLLLRGRLAMANRGPNTNGSQFFIVTASSTPWLDGLHTVFGEVTQGLNVVDAIENVETNPGPACKDHPIEDVVIRDVVIVIE